MAEEEYKKIFSKNLKYYMDVNGKNQMDLMRDLHLSSSTVSNWCTGLKLPRMDKVQMLADYFGINKSDLIEEKTKEEKRMARDERDISRRLEQTLADLESEQGALMFDGAPLDDETRELLKASLEHSIRVAKINAKKFTPKKYLDSKNQGK